MLWGRAGLAEAEQGRSGHMARQQPVVWDGEGTNWEVPVVMPDVQLGKSPFLPPQGWAGWRMASCCSGDNAGDCGGEQGMVVAWKTWLTVKG